jgi:hypothetical protein
MNDEAHVDRTDYRAAVYGSVLVAALLGALDAEHADPQAVVASLLATTFVFWIAHVWAGVVGENIRIGHTHLAARIGEVARAEWPLVEAGFVPLIPVVIAWIGPGTHHTGARLALVLAVVQLGIWGLVAGRRAHDTWFAAFLSGTVTAGLGLFVVLLEIQIH